MSKLIIFPTDTVYGIGCPIFETEGIKRIYEIKHRDLNKPLACLCRDLKQIEEIAVVDEKARKLIQAFMPGALTLILNAKPIVTKKIGYLTIGVRIPNSVLSQTILEENGPMLTTSVNESGEIPLNSYEEIYDVYHALVDHIYPSSEPSSNVSSTVIDLTHGEIRLLREGSITCEQIHEIIHV